MSIFAVERRTCRLCGAEDLKLVLQLAQTPVGDFFVPADRLDEVQETVPLDFLLCGTCGHVQLRNVVDPEAVYGEYTYVSSISLELPDHFRKYADGVIKRVRPEAGALVVELGSNEGALLNFFKKRGFRVLGIDPARAIAQKATEAGIETLPTFFTAELARKIRKDYGSATVVIANNVLANIDDLSNVAEGVRELLAPEGIFVLETSYLFDVVQKALIDTIFHEHLSYFAVKPLVSFFKRHGLDLIDAQRVSTKGGSLRCTVQLAGGPCMTLESVAEMIAIEEKAGINTPEAFSRLTAKLESVKNELLNLLNDLKAQGKTIAAYGAAVGLTTMVYYFDLGKILSFIVDDNEIKQGSFSPGYHIPVYSSQALYEKKPDYVLILAWRYAAQITKKHQKFQNQGGCFVLPLPKVEIV